MEPNFIRYQVHDFVRACEALAGSAQVEAGLTNIERETLCKSVQSLEEEVGALAPQSSMDDRQYDTGCKINNPDPASSQEAA